jgi:hypothetical protein
MALPSPPAANTMVEGLARHGRIVAFFAWRPDLADRVARYAFPGTGRPGMLFATAGPRRHLLVVEGLLASCFGIDGVAGVGGPLWQLSGPGLPCLAASGVRELTLLPADDEASRSGVLDVLEHRESPACSGIEVFVVDPALMAGARDLGELVRRKGSQALADVDSWRMEGDVYRTALVPWQ